MADKHKQSTWAGICNKLLNSNSLFYTYLRSIVSSQCAGWTDMLIGFLLFSWFDLTPFVATMIGALCGGIVNCIINYRFTFHAQGVDWRAVIVKYAIVWAGSMFLNAYGTQVIYSLISDWDWLQEIGFKPDGYYAAARVFTSLVVSWFWNFVMQRYFVYRSLWIDRQIVHLMESAGIKKHEK